VIAAAVPGQSQAGGARLHRLNAKLDVLV